MATIRILTGQDTAAVIRRVRADLEDPEIDRIVIHKPGSHLSSDGREFVVDRHGELQPLAQTAAGVGRAAVEGITTC
jgi:hypothetical protein